jgi:hypothetical protein
LISPTALIEAFVRAVELLGPDQPTVRGFVIEPPLQ